jgi:glutathione S-transferase kappa 1
MAAAKAAAAARVRLSVFYDVISPYSYIAFKILQRYKPIWPVEMKLRPVFLGGVMKLADNKPPGYHPLKMKHMMTDLQRQAETFQFPFSSPKDVEDHLFKKGAPLIGRGTAGWDGL